MIVVPITADQPRSAERCAALRVARAIDPASRTPDAIRDATHEVLSDPSYRANAAEFQSEMAALPGPDHAVRLLEALDREAVRT